MAECNSPGTGIAGPILEVSYSDDPRVRSEAVAEDYTIHVMPKTWRSGRISLLMAFGAMSSAMFWLYVAATVASVVGTANAVVGILLTCVTKGAMGFIFTQYASSTGLTVALLSRRLFGYSGAILAPLIFAAIAIYYTVFEGSIVAVALQHYVGFGDIRYWYLLVVALGVPLILGGVRTWLDKFNGYLLPIYLVGLIAVVTVGLSKYPGSLALPNASVTLAGPGWIWAFTVYMGVYVLMMYTVDYARFAHGKDARFHGIVTFGVAYYLFTYLATGLVGIFLAATVPGVIDTRGITETGLVDAIIGILGGGGLALIIISQARINTANLYLASSNLEVLGNRIFRARLPRIAWAVVAGLLVYILMLTNVFSYLLQALSWQGVFVVAWVAIAITHIVKYRKSEGDAPEFRPGRLAPLTPAAILWVGVSVLGIILVEFGGAFGATWASPITFVLASVGYIGVSRFGPILRRPFDPRQMVSNKWATRIRCHACDRAYTAMEMDTDPSAAHSAICAGCATTRSAFYPAALAEARNAQ